MAVLAAALPYLAAAGTVISAYGQVQSGREAKKDAYAQAAQLDDEANLAQANSQREAIEERRQARRASSRALAVAGASGGGVLDETVQTTIAGIEGEGEYRALSRLWQGDTEAQNLRDSATAARRTGKAQQRSSYYNAASTVLSTGSDLYSKYYKPKTKKTTSSTAAALDAY